MSDSEITEDLRSAARVRAHRLRMRREDRARHRAQNRVVQQNARVLTRDQIEELEAICMVYGGIRIHNANYFTRATFSLREVMTHFILSERGVRLAVKLLR